MAILHSILRLTNFRSPLLRTLVPSVSAAFAIQAAVAVPSIIAQNEKFYDFSGSLTFLSVTALSLYLPSLRAQYASSAQASLPSLFAPFTGAGGVSGLNWRQIALSGAVAIWAIRLGSYLFQRVFAEGKDSRFDEIKRSPAKFAGAFFGQATWVSLCLLPVIAVNSVPAAAFSATSAVKPLDVLGLLIYAGGFAFEIAADRQKSKWLEGRRKKEHDEQFLTKGFWALSQNPNYFGEISLWTGIATTAFGVLLAHPVRVGLALPSGLAGTALAASLSYVSPAFVSFLLLKVSGVPMSEKKYDKRFGDRKDYQEWKKNTPKLFPKLW